MNHFSPSSAAKLDTCHPRLQRLFDAVVYECDCTILCGERSKEDQDEAFRTGHSTVEWPQSLHNVTPEMKRQGLKSIAVDVAPYPIDWNNRDRFMHFAGIVRGIASTMDLKVRWGGNWDGGDLERQSFDDLVHFELG